MILRSAIKCFLNNFNPICPLMESGSASTDFNYRELFKFIYLFHSQRHTMSEIPRNKKITKKNRGVARGPQKPHGLYEEVPSLK